MSGTFLKSLFVTFGFYQTIIVYEPDLKQGPIGFVVSWQSVVGCGERGKSDPVPVGPGLVIKEPSS